MTPRSSVRAAARAIYREMAKGQGASPNASAKENTPTPDPSPLLASASGGGEKRTAPGESAEHDLTARVRALYEDSAVPVREIAALAGVTERTIYKYAARGAWRPRYRWTPDGARPVAFVSAFAPAKGAGGRFIRRADRDKPFARGLKATDPSGRARALDSCGQAAQVARAAQSQAQAESLARRRHKALLRAIDATTRAAAGLNAFRRTHAASLRRHAALLARHEAAKAKAQAAANEAAQSSGGEPPKHIVAAPAAIPRPLAHIARLESLHIAVAETALRIWRALPA